MPAFETLILPRGDGQTLAGYRMLPENPRAVVQICHGLAEHAGRYERFATALAEAGIATYAFDLRGHGRTVDHGGTLGIFAKVAGGDKVIADQAAIREHIMTEHPGVPIILMGHSMGALIAANVMLRQGPRYAGFLLMNTDFAGGLLLSIASGLLAVERMFRGSDTASRIAPKLSFKAWNKVYSPNRTEFDWLSRDEAEVDKYVADPLCGWDATVSMWRDAIGFVRFVADDRNLAGGEKMKPVRLVAGTGDPSSRMSKAILEFEARLEKAGYKNVTAAIYPDARHETLNETIRDEATADIVAWIDSVL